MKKIGRNISTLLLSAITTTASAGMDTPSLQTLADTNVALQLQGFTFPGGLIPGPNGKYTCNGTQLIETGWSGSGFIAKPDGTIVTNFHVAARALKGVAKFDNGANYEVRFIKAYSRAGDLAILQLAANQNFKTVTFGDSNTVRPLDPVLAVGNPGGMGLNITEGKVSQVQRNEQGEPEAIQHTAPIAPGNSGGALYRGGEVIGVNVRTWFGTQFHQAVPINAVKYMLSDKFEKRTLLREAFDPIAVIKTAIKSNTRRLEDVGAPISGVVPAGGKARVAIQLQNMSDYLILAETLDNADVDMLLRDSQGKPLGCGAASDPGGELIIKSITSEGGEVSVELINNHNVQIPARLHVKRIVW